MGKRRSGRKRSRNSFERYRAKRVGDLRHMLRCCIHGRLPPTNREYLEHVLRDEHKLPKPAEIAKRVNFTNAQREANKLWTIPPVDMTKKQLVKQRREKDKQRKMLARRRAHVQSRKAYLAAVASKQPWIKAGVKERTYYRHRAKALAAAATTNQPKENWL